MFTLRFQFTTRNKFDLVVCDEGKTENARVWYEVAIRIGTETNRS